MAQTKIPYALLVALPCEIKQRLASFLPPSDALNLALVCKNLHSSLALATLTSLPFSPRRRWTQWHRLEGDQCNESVRIPILHRRTHSIRVTLSWNDQGHGEQKGRLWVIGRPEKAERDCNKPFDGGRVVYESPPAPHDQSRLEIEFAPQEEEMYHIWYKVGSGGIHVLTIHEASVKSLIFDDTSHYFATNFKRLLACGVLSRLDQETSFSSSSSSLSSSSSQSSVPNFFTKLLLASCKALRLQLAAASQGPFVPDPIMLCFFEEHKIAVTEKSLHAVEEIIQADEKIRADILADNEARKARRERQSEVLQQHRLIEQQEQPPHGRPLGMDRWTTMHRHHPLQIPEHARQAPRWMIPHHPVAVDPDFALLGPFPARAGWPRVRDDDESIVWRDGGGLYRGRGQVDPENPVEGGDEPPIRMQLIDRRGREVWGLDRAARRPSFVDDDQPIRMQLVDRRGRERVRRLFDDQRVRSRERDEDVQRRVRRRIPIRLGWNAMHEIARLPAAEDRVREREFRAHPEQPPRGPANGAREIPTEVPRESEEHSATSGERHHVPAQPQEEATLWRHRELEDEALASGTSGPQNRHVNRSRAMRANSVSSFSPSSSSGN